MNKKKPFNRSTIFYTLILGSVNTYALEPAAIEAGIFDIVPTVSVETGRNSNMLRTNENEIDSNFLLITPKVQARLENNANQYIIEAEVMKGDYSASDEDSYTDWRIGATGHIELNSRNLLELNASTYATHEARGTGFSEGGRFSATPDEYDLTDFGIGYQFGARDSRGRVTFNLSSQDKEYSNNRMTTVERDRKSTTAKTAFYLNIFPSSDIFIEYQRSNINYKNDSFLGSGTKDSKESYLYLGLAWDTTAQTSGSLKLGRSTKDFASSSRKNYSAPSWEIDLTWRPLSYSTFSFGTSNRFDEGRGTGESVERKDYNLNWRHTWSQRFSTTASIAYSDDTHEGETLIRKDDQLIYQVGLTYSYARWLDITVSARRDDRDSNLNIYNYQQSVFTLGFQASL